MVGLTIKERNEGKILLEIRSKGESEILEFPVYFWRKQRTLSSFVKKLQDDYEFTKTERELRILLEKSYKDFLNTSESKKEKPVDVDEASHTILSDPNLLQKIDTELDKKIVREHKARKAVLLFICGRYVQNAQPTSYNLCISDDSGKGKDWLADATLRLFEEGENKDYIKTEKITPELLDALSKTVDWNQKIFYNADIRGNVLNSNTFKVFSSGATTFYTYKDGVAVKTSIKGKPVMIITTAKNSSNEELTRRFMNLPLSDEKDQTAEIMKRWASYKEKGKSSDYSPKIRKALQQLRPVDVRIPFAACLVGYFPSDHRIMRTQWTRFLDLIMAVTALYQFQRETDKEGYLLSTWSDYDTAAEILRYTLSDGNFVPLSKTDKKIIQALKDGTDRMRVSTLEVLTHFTPKTLRDRLMQLADFGIVAVDEATKEEKEEWKTSKPTMVFSYCSIDSSEIPKSKEILSKLSNNSNNGNFDNNSNNGNNTPKQAESNVTKDTKSTEISKDTPIEQLPENPKIPVEVIKDD